MKQMILAAVLAACASASQAELVVMSQGQEVFDTQTRLVWTRDWNVFSPWADARQWATDLTLDGVAPGTWRLPTPGEWDTLFGYGLHLDQALLDYFVLPSGHYIWTDQASALDPSVGVLASVWGGFADATWSGEGDLTAAVRVPEPMSLTLACLALGLAGWTTRRRSGA